MNFQLDLMTRESGSHIILLFLDSFLLSISAVDDMQRESLFFKPFAFTKQIKSRGSPHVAKLSVANFLSSDSLFCFFALSVAKV